MTSWKDTPDMKGFLPTAIADAQVALEQIERADLEGRINDFWLHGGYVLNALAPGAETDALLKTAYARLHVEALCSVSCATVVLATARAERGCLNDS